jgi:hypothetical protein
VITTEPGPLVANGCASLLKLSVTTTPVWVVLLVLSSRSSVACATKNTCCFNAIAIGHMDKARGIRYACW